VISPLAYCNSLLYLSLRDHCNSLLTKLHVDCPECSTLVVTGTRSLITLFQSCVNFAGFLSANYSFKLGNDDVQVPARPGAVILIVCIPVSIGVASYGAPGHMALPSTNNYTPCGEKNPLQNLQYLQNCVVFLYENFRDYWGENVLQIEQVLCNITTICENGTTFDF